MDKEMPKRRLSPETREFYAGLPGNTAQMTRQDLERLCANALHDLDLSEEEILRLQEAVDRKIDAVRAALTYLNKGQDNVAIVVLLEEQSHD